MAIELKSGFIGLVTETADLQAPPGALTRAKNVVIRRAGACEVRPGLSIDGQLGCTERTIRLIPFGFNGILANENAEWWNAGVNAAITYVPPDGSAPISPPTFADDLIPSAQARGNLYVGTGLGVVKLTDEDVSDFQVCGVPLVFSTASGASTTPGWLANNMQVAYSVVGVKTDDNDLVTRSRPSGAVYYVNTSGGTVNPGLTVRGPFPSALYDSIEIYRTRAFPTSVTPDTEMQLVGTIVPTSGTTNFSDRTADANRGATLYTSPSREGAESANDLPPACGALAVFKGALFCGNTVGPQRVIASVNYTDPSTNLAGSATGVGQRTYNGTITSGSADITAVASTVGLQKGMRYSGGLFPSGAYITNISGATVTMSQVATGSLAASPVRWNDSITLDGGTTWFSFTDYIAFGAPITDDWISYRVTPPVGGYGTTFVVESLMQGTGANLAVKATHGDEYSAPLPLYDDPASSPQDEMKNGLRWSKPDEPEHFPPSNFAFVGDKRSEILGLVSTRDAMFIFKEDGIWRLTGTNGQYRIDPFDLTTFCVWPGSIVPLKNRIFMLSNRGVVAVSDAEGVEVVSAQIASQLKPMISTLRLNAFNLGGYYLDGIGYAGAASEIDNEYMLLVGDALMEGASGIENGALVYNDVTRAWTSWEFNAAGDELGATPTTWGAAGFGTVIGVLDYAQIGTLRSFARAGTLDPTGGDEYACDGALPLNVTDVVGDVVTFDTPYDVRVGDAITGGATIGRITAVNGPTEVVVYTGAFGATMEVGPGFLMRPITCTVRPRAFIAPNQVQKQWTQYTSEFSQMFGALTMTTGALSSVIAAITEMTEQPGDIKVGHRGTQYRMGASIRGLLPVDAARGWRMHAETTWTQVIGATTLEAIFAQTVDGRPNTPNLATAP